MVGTDGRTLHRVAGVVESFEDLQFADLRCVVGGGCVEVELTGLDELQRGGRGERLGGGRWRTRRRW